MHLFILPMKKKQNEFEMISLLMQVGMEILPIQRRREFVSLPLHLIFLLSLSLRHHPHRHPHYHYYLLILFHWSQPNYVLLLTSQQFEGSQPSSTQLILPCMMETMMETMVETRRQLWWILAGDPPQVTSIRRISMAFIRILLSTFKTMTMILLITKKKKKKKKRLFNCLLSRMVGGNIILRNLGLFLVYGRWGRVSTSSLWTQIPSYKHSTTSEDLQWWVM